MDLVARAKGLILDPRAEWWTIAGERTSPASLIASYVAILATIPAVCGFIGTSIVGIAGYLWKGDLHLGIIVAAAMLLNMIAAALSGVLVPFTLRALRIDPALASGILVTTVTDVAGFFFFLGLAALAVKWFVR